MPHRYRTTAVAVIASVLLAACGGDDTDSANSGAAATTVAATTQPPSATTESEPAGDDEPPAPAATTPPAPATAPTTAAPTTTTTVPLLPTPPVEELNGYLWTEVNEAARWSARAGLRIVELGDRLFVLGGRTPNQSTIPGDSQIWGDVWASDDRGETWSEVRGNDDPEGFEPRAYFQAVVKDGEIFVIGGQDFGLEPNPFCALLEQGIEPPAFLDIDPDAPCPEFLPTSRFFNNVWSSSDGSTWTERTSDAPWEGRAGLSAAVLGEYIYVFGGSTNDDSAIIGADGPARIYYNDVWRTIDGAEWELVSEQAPWEPRAGAAVVVRSDTLFVLGGEDGFTCSPLPDCDAPYFNDVWSTTDGANWTLLTEAAGWSPRPGHMCELIGTQIVCFGGFGLISNPLDVWASFDGATWVELDGSPWNALTSEEAKYDFDAITIVDANGDDVIVTVGGDRETFDFTDPENYLRIDNDVWTFSPAG